MDSLTCIFLSKNNFKLKKYYQSLQVERLIDMNETKKISYNAMIKSKKLSEFLVANFIEE